MAQITLRRSLLVLFLSRRGGARRISAAFLPLLHKSSSSAVISTHQQGSMKTRTTFGSQNPLLFSSKDDDRDLPEGKNGLHNKNDEKRVASNNQGDAPLGGDNGPRTGWLHNKEPSEEAIQKTTEQTSLARRRLELAMREQEQNHRILAPPAFHACGEGRCVVVTEHVVSVPLFYSKPRSPRIDVYFSIVEKVTDENREWLESIGSLSQKQRAQKYVQQIGLTNADEMVVYLQGGPGFGSPTPMVSLGFSQGSSWGAVALDHYSRVVLMDQRGTGRSTTITKQFLEMKYPDLFLLDKNEDAKTKSLHDFCSSNPEEALKVKQAVEETTEWMAHFRADNIVRDAEEIKDVLMMPTEEPVTEPRPWGCALGQSFGGFCMMSYLSLIANPPRICLLTGGIAPMLTPVYDVYTALWDRVKERSLLYYEKYPGDIPLVKRIVQKLLSEEIFLPSGGRLTARRFLQLGLGFGGSPSIFASFHALISTTLVDGTTDSDFTRAFLKAMDSEQSFDDHPIYYWMHESIYGDGPTNNSPTNWAAHRAYEDLVEGGNKEYNYRYTSALIDDDSQPTLFFGEMVFPWMPEDFEELSGVGLRAVADELAAKTDWGTLFDGDHMRKVLSNGTCRAAAAVYHDDMYVDFNASMKVAARGGPLEKCKVWITNEYQHSGLRDSGSSMFSKLHGMAIGEIRTPS